MGTLIMPTSQKENCFTYYFFNCCTYDPSRKNIYIQYELYNLPAHLSPRSSLPPVLPPSCTPQRPPAGLRQVFISPILTPPFSSPLYLNKHHLKSEKMILPGAVFCLRACECHCKVKLFQSCTLAGQLNNELKLPAKLSKAAGSCRFS